jgi:hypothetical protein
VNFKTSEDEQRWIEDYCNEAISAEEFAKFQDALEAKVELRVAFRKYLSLDAGLRQGSESMQEIGTAWQSDKVSESTKIVAFPVVWQWTAIAALLIVGLFLAIRPAPVTPIAQAEQKIEPSAQGFAVLTGVDDAEWASHPELGSGDLLPSGEIRLRSGVAQLELFSGVTLIVEGDARFEIHSAMDISVSHGKLRANVPEPAHGFRIRSAAGEVVDLGTEFAVNITSNKSEVHVLDGAVEWHPADQQNKRLMKKGEALSSDQNGTQQQLVAKASDFVGMRELNLRLNSGRSDRRNDWLSHSRELARDERMVAYFPMSQPGLWHRRLYNEARGEHATTDGAIVVAKRAVDRFGYENGALDFSGTGSRVRLNVSKELTALTLAAWVKIDSLDRWYNSLLLTDGHELNEPHWQIMNDGRLFFSVKKRDYDREQKLADKQVVYSRPFWTPAMSGKWTQLVTTYDTSNQTVIHYVNGKRFHQEVLPENMRVDRVKIGPATIGNWSEPTRNESKFAVRNLNGSMDEFAIFSAALTADEIAELFKHGRP